MKTGWSEILAMVFVLAIISLLVRPASLGPQLVATSGTALTELVRFAVSS